MKSKALIKILEEYPDFDVNVHLNLNMNKSPKERPLWQSASITALGDIGHSEKVIILDIK